MLDKCTLERLGVNLSEAEQIKGGSHSQVFRYKQNGGMMVAKIKMMPGACSMEVETLRDDVVAYCAELERLDIPVLAGQVTACDEKAVVIQQEFMGPDYASLIQHKEKRIVEQKTHELLDVLEILFAHSSDQKHLEAGLDPLPANFAGGKFIDVMPPRYRRMDKALVDIPEPEDSDAWDLAYWRAYTSEGLLMLLRTQLCRIRPQMRIFFCDAITQVASCYGCDEYFCDLPGNGYVGMSRQQKRRIIEAVDSSTGMYVLRDIACELTFQDPSRFSLEWLEKAFQATHFKGKAAETPASLIEQLVN